MEKSNIFRQVVLLLMKSDNPAVDLDPENMPCGLSERQGQGRQSDTDLNNDIFSQNTACADDGLCCVAVHQKILAESFGRSQLMAGENGSRFRIGGHGRWSMV